MLKDGHRTSDAITINSIKEQANESPLKQELKCYKKLIFDQHIESNPEYFLADGIWIDTWITFILGQYFLRIFRGPKPRGNINMFVLKNIVDNEYIELNTDRSIYLLNFSTWECIKSIYGSVITLKRGRTKEIRAYYYDDERIETNIIIKNQRDLDSMTFLKLKEIGRAHV